MKKKTNVKRKTNRMILIFFSKCVFLVISFVSLYKILDIFILYIWICIRFYFYFCFFLLKRKKKMFIFTLGFPSVCINTQTFPITDEFTCKWLLVTILFYFIFFWYFIMCYYLVKKTWVLSLPSRLCINRQTYIPFTKKEWENRICSTIND